jgi:hypothetical protein
VASLGTKLVERLRLGEHPEGFDWTLASALISLLDAARRFRESVEELIADSGNYSRRARFQTRLGLLAADAGTLLYACRRLQDRLSAYFSARTETVDDRPVGDDAVDPGSQSGGAPGAEVKSRCGEALVEGGVERSKASLVGNAVEQVLAECGWLESALSELVATKPSVEATLDFLAELEARFGEETFLLPGVSRKQTLEEALLGLLEESARGR